MIYLIINATAPGLSLLLYLFQIRSVLPKYSLKKGRLILSIYKEHFETVKVQRFCYSSCFNPQMCSKIS